MPAPAAILDLVARFGEHIDAYKSGSYNETQLRRDFLDPFFKLLGWDIDNTSGYDEAYRDVIHEDQVKVGGAVQAPDYGFRIGGTRKFFLEAKKPSVRIKDDISPAYQVRHYAWSAKLPLSILSDFEEFAIYDTRIKPLRTDAASKARIFYCRFDEYVEKWDYISGIFSREAILKGSFDKFAAANKGKRGTTEVDADFLATIEGWRADLAKNLALRNPDLTQRELNFAVQRILDRIIFLRICEDRGIEDYERLKRAAEAKAIYPELVKLFQQADDRYNSGLFHFRAEKGRHEDHDTLTPHLVIDDKLLKGIVTNLYYPHSDYAFRYMPADILGQVYEQFLGKVITLSAGHRAQVEDKPEVKKAGGVFYTPTYIVDYIVRQTVGPLVEGKTPKQIEKLTVLDPACGSGSFLIGAYQFLLDWYHRYYTTHEPESHAKGKAPKLVAASGGGWALTTTERKRILLTHIYGVDIDSQAVEVTKLSLLLKVLEGETAQTVQRELIHERVLPDLGDNIKCGNSLIASDFYAQKDLPEMDAEAHLRINVFDWDGKDGFPEIMKRGGFDAVIGNPPYVRIQRIAHTEADYLFTTYETPTSKMDMSLVFLEKSLRLINNRGRAAFICTSQWLSTDYGRNLRRKLKAGELHQIVDFGSLPVFATASTYPAIFTLSRLKASEIEVKRITSRDNLNLEGIVAAPSKHLVLDSLSDAPWMLGDFDLVAASKAKSYKTIPLRDFGKAYIGCKTGMNDAFILSKEDAISKKLEAELVFPYAYRGEEVERYCQVEPGYVVIYPYRKGPEGQSLLLDADELAAKFPNIHAHLTQYRPDLKQRQDSRKFYAAGADWFRHLRPGNFNYIDNPKLVFKAISRQSCGGLLASRAAFDGANCPAILVENLNGHRLHYLLGVLNSRVLSHYLRQVCPPKLGGYVKFSATCLSDAPIRVIDPKNKADQAAHDRIVKLVEQMLKLHQDRAAAKTPHEQTALERQITATDKQIDQEVYALYGLTAEEIDLVEGRSVAEIEPPAPADEPASQASPDRTPYSPSAGGYAGHMVFREEPVDYKTKPS